MYSFEKTDLSIIEIETENGNEVRLYTIRDISESDDFNAQTFLDEMDKVMPKVDKNPELFDALLDRYNIIDIFDEEDIEELIDEGMIDPEDLHQSLFDYIISEQNPDLDFSDLDSHDDN